MEYGISSALKGFFGSADAKSARTQQLALLQNMYNQDQAERNASMQLEMGMMDFNTQIDDFANNIIQGKGIRESDLDAYKMLNQEARKILEEKVRQSGGIVKFMQGGGAKALQDYKNAITNSELSVRLSNNAKAFKQGLLATQNLDANGNSVQTAHLVPQSFIQNLQNYQAGLVDDIVWNGLLTDYDTDGIDPEAIGADKVIDAALVFAHNPMNKQYAEENMEKDLGITRAQFLQYAVTQEDYERQNQLFDRKLEEYYNAKNGTMYGRGEVEVSVTGTFTKIAQMTQDAMPTIQDANGNSIPIYKANAFDENGMLEFKKYFVENGAGDEMESTFGYDYNWTPTTKNGRQIRNVGGVFSNYEDEIMKLTFGENYEDGVVKAGTQRSGDGTWFVGGSGSKIGAGQTHRGQTLWTTEGSVLADGDDVYFRGITVSQKVSGINPDTGEYEEHLLTYDPDDPTSHLEDYQKFNGLKISQVYVAEFYDVDALEYMLTIPGTDISLAGEGMSDVYYKELNMEALMPRLEQDLDINEQLTNARTQKVKFERQYKQQKNIEKQNLKALENQMVIDIVGEPFDAQGNSNMNKIYNYYYADIDTSLSTAFGSNRNKNLDPHLFTFIFHEAMKTHPGEYHNRAKQNIAVLPDMMETDLMQVVKTGNIGNFYEYLKLQGFDYKTIKKNTKYIKRALFDNDFSLNNDGTINYKRRKN